MTTTPEPEAARLSGTIPILVTPFTDEEEIDYASLEAEIEDLATLGITWVGIGFGSEVQRLTGEELHAVVRAIRAHGRLNVIANTDATSIRAARISLDAFHADGADAVLVRPPAIGGLPADRVIEAFQLVADSSPLPLIIQDASDMTGVQLPAHAIATLLRDSPTIAGVKLESRDAAEKISQLRTEIGAEDSILLGGNGGASYARQLRRGIDGTMPGPAFAPIFLRIEAAHRAGDHDLALSLQSRLAPFLHLGERNMDTFIYAHKFALQRQGILRNTVLRRPHSLEHSALLDEELTGLTDQLGTTQ